MAEPVTIDLRHLARGLSFSVNQVQAVVELLDEGNTVPFITRYRKDKTGGLDEEQIRQIHMRLVKMRQLNERKQTILRSIEMQGKLTDELSKRILAAGTTKRLEDLYLPFKPRKQTLATTARSRGLEPLALEILEASPSCADLDRRAADFVNPDKHVPTAAEALLGAGHIVAELFSERAELRQALREVLEKTGRLASSRIGGDPKPAEKPPAKPREAKPRQSPRNDVTVVGAQRAFGGPDGSMTLVIGAEGRLDYDETIVLGNMDLDAEGVFVETVSAPMAPLDGMASSPAPAAPLDTAESDDEAGSGMGGGDGEEGENGPHAAAPTPAEDPAPAVPEVAAPSPPVPAPPISATPLADGSSPAADTAASSGGETAGNAAPAGNAGAEMAKPASGQKPRAAGGSRPAAPGPRPRNKNKNRKKREEEKRKAEEQRQKAFADYFDYHEDLRKVPPHRVLAINRGERERVLRVKVECNIDALHQVLDEVCVPEGHPHAEFLRGCARDALQRLIMPSLEREVRREQTEKAELHAVTVFAKNLRSLLLQPPIRGKRVLAIDPGYKNGCKMAALDQFGNVLAHDIIFLVGKPERKEEGRRKIIELVDRYQLGAIVIGNGTGSRDAEDFVGTLLAGELKDKGVAYVMVNEAGASVYSTSRTGREEFPHYDASLRGAISIGRRLQDPLSELVKIEPANIGVGLYQHDVKAKHLQTSLDEVVESCVNYVGVDVNTASPALLRYVSGLNQLTARRVYEHRLERGAFRNREQLKQVPGVGDATFVQSAGFLKIAGGDNPLDATWIHPESYEVAARVMQRLGIEVAELERKESAAAVAEKIAKAEVPALAQELGIGELLLRDILAQLKRPGRDPREDLPAPILKRGVMRMEDLAAGMELMGTVLNVVDFGAFVDIGMHDSGLVHVSQMADRFVRDPHEVVSVGDIVTVWVVDVDKTRRRVSLTMIAPGTPRTPPGRQGQGQSQGQGRGRPEGGAGRGPAARGSGQAGGRPSGSGQGSAGHDGSSGDRPPRQRFDRRGGSGGPPRGGYREGPPKHVPKPRPKPVIPITDEMKTGKAPLRSFSDLAQFMQVQKEPAEPPRPARPKPEPPSASAAEPPSPAESMPPDTAPPQQAPSDQVSSVTEAGGDAANRGGREEPGSKAADERPSADEHGSAAEPG